MNIASHIPAFRRGKVYESVDKFVESPLIRRLNLAAIPTTKISWDQPHEGNLFDHLYARRAFQRHRVSDLALPEFGPNQSVQR